VGDIVEVKVLSVDLQKERISLTMRLEDAPEGEKKVAGATGKPANRKPEGNGKRPEQKRDNKGNRQNGPKSPRKEEFAPGTIGYILAHQNDRKNRH
jgi:uncharacterized protein